MSSLGLGPMLGALSGNDKSVIALQNALGKKISKLEMKDDALHIHFEDNSGIRVWDDGQSCCENRYMMTDDNLNDFIGSTLTGMELRDAPDQPYEGGDHEVQFLLVNTSLGTFTMATHNEHNGYYGGFWIVIREEE